MSAPLDGSIMRVEYNGYKRSKYLQRTYTGVELSVAFPSVCAEIKWSSGNGPYCCRIHGKIYHLVSPLYPNQGNTRKLGYGQLNIFGSAEATTKILKA
jgi:hypothetical protein